MRNLLEPVYSSIFSVMCDGYTEAFNKEQLTFCICWVNNDLEVSGKILGFYEIPDKKSSTNVAVMKDILLRYQILICAEVKLMMVLAICRENHPVLPLRFLQNNQRKGAHYIHCHAHSLSLSAKEVTKNAMILRDTMGTAEEITVLIKYSPK